MLAASHISDDLQLFHLIAEGDEDAFRQLYTKYSRILYSRILRMLKSEHDATDVIQETFLRVWLQRAKLREIDNPGGWINRMAANMAVDMLRSQAYKELYLQSQVDAPVSVDNEAAIEARFTRTLIDQAIGALPERRRQIFLLARIEGRSRRDIADELGISENTVRNQLADAVVFVQEYLQAHGAVYIPAFILLMQLV